MLQLFFNESFYPDGPIKHSNVSNFELLEDNVEGTSTTPLTMHERCHWSKENAEGIDVSPDYKFKKDPCNEEYAVVKHQRSESYFIYYNKSDKKRKMA